MGKKKENADKETLERYRIDKFDQHFEIDTTCLLSRNNIFTIDIEKQIDLEIAKNWRD